MKTPRNSGFTIVELLIVIVVIAILAAITVIAYNGITQRATVSVAKADLRNAATKLGTIHAESGLYPLTIPSDLRASGG